MKLFRLIIKIISRTIVVVFLLVLLLIFACWLELRFDSSLPLPKGEYAVGRVTEHWVDSNRIDSLSPTPYTKRELLVWIWYPASVSTTDKHADYDHAEWGTEINKQRNFIFKNFMYRDGHKIHTHSYSNASLSAKQNSYPVIIMRSGIGREATGYTAYAEELASHGYIVVGYDAPYSTFKISFPGGRIIEKTADGNPGEAEFFSEQRSRVLNRLVQIWSADARFVLDHIAQINSYDTASRFFGHINCNTVGIFGHSFGGATAAQFCADDLRCKAGADLDGVPYGSVIEKGLNKPFMFLLADHGDENDTVSRMIKANIASIYNSAPTQHLWVSLKGAQHFNFTDFPYQSAYLVSRLTGAIGVIGGKRALEISSGLLVNFFNKHLKGEKDSITVLSKKYAEIQFEKPRHTK